MHRMYDAHEADIGSFLFWCCNRDSLQEKTVHDASEIHAACICCWDRTLSQKWECHTTIIAAVARGGGTSI